MAERLYKRPERHARRCFSLLYTCRMHLPHLFTKSVSNILPYIFKQSTHFLENYCKFYYDFPLFVASPTIYSERLVSAEWPRRKSVNQSNCQFLAHKMKGQEIHSVFQFQATHKKIDFIVLNQYFIVRGYYGLKFKYCKLNQVQKLCF